MKHVENMNNQDAVNCNFEVPVIFQDNDLIVVEKPEGMAVHKNDYMLSDVPCLIKLVDDITGTRGV